MARTKSPTGEPVVQEQPYTRPDPMWRNLEREDIKRSPDTRPIMEVDRFDVGDWLILKDGVEVQIAAITSRGFLFRFPRSRSFNHRLQTEFITPGIVGNDIYSREKLIADGAIYAGINSPLMISDGNGGAVEKPKPAPRGNPDGVVATLKKWNGHSTTGLMRWMGANDWTEKQALAVLAKLELTVNPATFNIQFNGGRKGTRGAPPEILPLHVDELNEMRGVSAVVKSRRTK